MNHPEAPISDELLNAWLDDELSATERERVAAALARQPALAARLDVLRLANEMTRRHAQAIDALPLSPRLSALLESAPGAGPQSATTAEILPWPQRLRRWSGTQPLALAAGLLLAVGLSYSVLQRSAGDGVGAGASTELAVHAALLEQIASGERVALGDLALSPRFSFLSTQGQWCRLYRVDAPTLSSDEVACRGANGWELRASLPATTADATQYLPAGSDPAALDAVLDELMQGSPLPLANEAELIREGWNRSE